MKKILFNVIKISVVGLLLFWLSSTGKLHFSELAILIDRPWVLAGAVGLWLVASVYLGSVRWRMLLVGMGIEIPMSRVIKLQLIGFFFNTAMPGAVGGDVIKGVYVVRDKSATSRTNAVLSILLDRIIGLVAIFMIAGLAILLRLDFVAGNSGFMSLAIFVAIGTAGVAVAGVFCLTNIFEGRDPFVKLLSLKVPGFRLLLKVYNAFMQFRRDPATILKAVAISVIIQGMSLSFSFVLATMITGQDIDFMIYGLVHPIGILATALPLAPGGLGIGHVAFDRLFVMAGWRGGANVFNVLVLSQLALNLLGFIPYLLNRSEIQPLPESVASNV